MWSGSLHLRRHAFSNNDVYCVLIEDECVYPISIHMCENKLYLCMDRDLSLHLSLYLFTDLCIENKTGS